MSPLTPTANDAAMRIESDLDSQDAAERQNELVHRLKLRDVAAFQQLMDEYGPSLQRLVSRLMAYGPDSEDAFQQTMLQVWRKIDGFRHESQFSTWLNRIAITQTRNYQRSARRWWRRLDLFRQDRATNHDVSEVKPHDPRWERIQIAMNQLSYRERELLVRVYLEENTIAQIASEENLRVNTIEVRLHRAKQKLKQLLSSDETGASSHA